MVTRLHQGCIPQPAPPILPTCFLPALRTSARQLQGAAVCKPFVAQREVCASREPLTFKCRSLCTSKLCIGCLRTPGAKAPCCSRFVQCVFHLLLFNECTTFCRLWCVGPWCNLCALCICSLHLLWRQGCGWQLRACASDLRFEMSDQILFMQVCSLRIANTAAFHKRHHWGLVDTPSHVAPTWFSRRCQTASAPLL